MLKHLQIAETMTVQKKTIKTVLLKLDVEVHEELIKNAGLQKRSMQRIIEQLVKNWIANGSPDPYSLCDSSSESQPVNSNLVSQHAARLVRVEEALERINKHLSGFQ